MFHLNMGLRKNHTPSSPCGKENDPAEQRSGVKIEGRNRLGKDGEGGGREGERGSAFLLTPAAARRPLRARQRSGRFATLLRRKLPAAPAGALANLIGPPGAAQRDGNARLMNGPIDDQLGHGVADGLRDYLEPVDQVVIFLPFLAQNIGYFCRLSSRPNT